MSTQIQIVNGRPQATGPVLIAEIVNGSFDKYLRDIGNAVSARWKAIEAIKGMNIEVGAKVRVRADSRRYSGMVGRVTGKRGKWITVVEDSTRAFPRTVDFSPTLLEVIQ